MRQQYPATMITPGASSSRWQNAQYQATESRRLQLLEMARQASVSSETPMEADHWAAGGTRMAATVRAAQSPAGTWTMEPEPPRLSLLSVGVVRTPPPLPGEEEDGAVSPTSTLWSLSDEEA